MKWTDIVDEHSEKYYIETENWYCHICKDRELYRWSIFLNGVSILMGECYALQGAKLAIERYMEEICKDWMYNLYQVNL